MTLALPKLRQVRSPNYSARTEAIDLIVIHDCEGSYGGSISWFQQSASQVSAHFVVKEDGTEATQMVAEADKAWHACDFNSRSIGIEMGGYAARGFPDAELATMANIVAFLLHKHGLPVRWAAGGQGSGFCSHYELGAAGGGHHDPSTSPAWVAAFVAKVEAASKLTMPAAWTIGAEPIAAKPPALPAKAVPVAKAAPVITHAAAAVGGASAAAAVATTHTAAGVGGTIFALIVGGITAWLRKRAA